MATKSPGEFADKMNSIAKYIISTALEKPNGRIHAKSRTMFQRKFPNLRANLVWTSWFAGKCQLLDMLIQNQLIDGYPKRANESLKSILKLPDSEGKEGKVYES